MLTMKQKQIGAFLHKLFDQAYHVALVASNIINQNIQSSLDLTQYDYSTF